MSDDRRRLRESARRQAEYDREVRRVHREIEHVERWKAIGRVIFGVVAVIGPMVFWSLVIPTTADDNWVLTVLYQILIVLSVIGMFWLRRVVVRRFMARMARRSGEQRTETEADHG
jgi:cytochrome c biogenesis protein CcdA